MAQRMSNGLSFSVVLAGEAVVRHGGALSTSVRLRVLIRPIDRLPKCSSWQSDDMFKISDRFYVVN